MFFEFTDSIKNHRSSVLISLLWSALVVTIPFVFLKIVHMYFNYKNSKYKLTESNFQHETGILSKTTNNLELWRVQDIQLRQSFMQRLFKETTILLYTSDASSSVKTIEGLKPDQAKQVFDEILAKLSTQRQQNRVLNVGF